jgi:Fe-S oxidoreductase
LTDKRTLTDEINPEIREFLIEMGAQDVFKCYQCGKCASVCPWFQVGTYDFPVYRFPLEAALGMMASSEDKDELMAEVDRIYRCVGCEACVNQCPHGVDIPSILRAARRILVEYGSYPDALKDVVGRIRDTGSPTGDAAEKRLAWAEDLEVPAYEPGMDYVFFSCCISSYDQRIREVSRAIARVLKAAGVSFGLLAAADRCCSEAIRRVGAEEVFLENAASLAEVFNGAFEGAASGSAASAGSESPKVLVNSPHCYTTFKNEYPEQGARFEAVHTTQVLAGLIADGRIKPAGEFPKKVVYHDPCTLGRQNGVYEEPREILRSIPGLDLLEVPNFNRQFSVCCGAGSGALWTEWEKDERIVAVRLEQLAATGADVIAVACPYCQQMLEETAKSTGLEIEIMDVAEILAASLE